MTTSAPAPFAPVLKRAYDWAVYHLADLFRTTHEVKASDVTRSNGKKGGGIEANEILAGAAGSKSLSADLRLTTLRLTTNTGGASGTCIPTRVSHRDFVRHRDTVGTAFREHAEQNKN